MKRYITLFLLLLNSYIKLYSQVSDKYHNHKIVYEIFKNSIEEYCYNMWVSLPGNKLYVEIYLDSLGQVVDIGKIEIPLKYTPLCYKVDKFSNNLKCTDKKFRSYSTSPEISKTDLFEISNNKVKYLFILNPRHVSFFEDKKHSSSPESSEKD